MLLPEITKDDLDLQELLLKQKLTQIQQLNGVATGAPTNTRAAAVPTGSEISNTQIVPEVTKTDIVPAVTTVPKAVTAPQPAVTEPTAAPANTRVAAAPGARTAAEVTVETPAETAPINYVWELGWRPTLVKEGMLFEPKHDQEHWDGTILPGIRKEWYDKYGLAMPTNVEDYYKQEYLYGIKPSYIGIVKSFRENGPEMNPAYSKYFTEPAAGKTDTEKQLEENQAKLDELSQDIQDLIAGKTTTDAETGVTTADTAQADLVNKRNALIDEYIQGNGFGDDIIARQKEQLLADLEKSDERELENIRSGSRAFSSQQFLKEKETAKSLLQAKQKALLDIEIENKKLGIQQQGAAMGWAKEDIDTALQSFEFLYQQKNAGNEASLERVFKEHLSDDEIAALTEQANKNFAGSIINALIALAEGKWESDRTNKLIAKLTKTP